jgi:hypothetical protein
MGGEKYINITFQIGPVGDVGVNGCQTEDVIELLVERIRAFQLTELSCRQNAVAITKLEEANMWLRDRTRARGEQEVEGTMEAHK